MKIIVKKTDEGVEFTLEDATVEDCIKIVKHLDNPESEVKDVAVNYIYPEFFTASGRHLDSWGIVLDLPRIRLEPDVDYRKRLTDKLVS